jgi:glycosidase
MPFYPTADRDDGYDITDYDGVDPGLGSAGDFVEVVRTARDRGMRVNIDLVVNHTSDRHPWFRSARSSRTSPFRDFYVWRADAPPDTSKDVVFPDQEHSIWEYDEKTEEWYLEEWYLHGFYRTQPDLNITNPLVRDEIAKAMGFWLELGISGFRVNAVPFMLETTGVDEQELARFHDPHHYLRTLRSFLGRRAGDGILLGEVNLPHEQQETFFGGTEGDELTIPRTHSGRPSCATTTSSPWTSSTTRSARRSSPRSAPTRGCRCTRVDCEGGFRPCWTATRAGSGWPTA